MKLKLRWSVVNVILLIMLAYLIFDLRNSAIVGNSNQNRTVVYVFLIVLMVVLAIPLISRLKQGRLDNLQVSFIFLLGWMLLSNLFNNLLGWSTYVHLGLVLLWFLLYSFFKMYSVKQTWVKETIRKTFLFFFIIYLFALFYGTSVIRASTTRTGVSINVAYYVLVFLPLLFEIKNKVWKFIALAALVFSVMWSLKRGAILAMILMFLVYVVLPGKITKKTHGFLKLIFICALVLVAVLVVDELLAGQLLSRFSKEMLADGSGRAFIYSSAWSVLRSRSVGNLLIGTGAGSSVASFGSVAHDDWLEFALCYGVIGVLFYLFFIVALIRKTIILYKKHNRNAVYLAMLSVYVITVGIYGQIMFAQSTMYVIAMFGYFSAMKIYLPEEEIS